MTVPSASGAIRSYHCGAWSVLPGAVIEFGDYAETGNIVHDFMDICKTQSRSIALEKYAKHEEYRTLRQIPVDDLLTGVTHIATEVAFAVNVYTGEVQFLGHHLNRKYNYFPEDSGWICGSEDVVGMRDGNPIVADYKNGDDVGDISDNLQVGFHAIAVAELTGAETVEGCIVYTRPPVNESSYIFTKFDRNIILDKLRVAYDNYRKSKEIVKSGQLPPVYPNDHCKYCPAMNACPKWSSLVRHFAPELEHINFNSGALTVEKLGELWPKFKQFKGYFEEAYDQVKGLVQKHGKVPLRNGKHLALVPSSREYINGKKAVALLRLYGAPEEEIEELYRTTEFNRLMEKK